MKMIKTDMTSLHVLIQSPKSPIVGVSRNIYFNMNKHSFLGLYRVKADAVDSELINDKNGNKGKDNDNGKANVRYDPRIHLIRVRNPWGDKNEWRGK